MEEIKILQLISDADGCFQYRARIPFGELKRFSISCDMMCFLPSDPIINQDDLLVDCFKNYDMIIVQRCYLFDLVYKVKQICEFLGIPLVYETDDDYFNIPQSNPAFYSIIDNQELFRNYNILQQRAQAAANKGETSLAAELTEQYKTLIPELMQSRARGLSGYAEILKMVDWVTVSTQELADTIYLYNKNVVVFENNVERIFPWKDSYPLEPCLQPHHEVPNAFHIKPFETMGLFSVPNYRDVDYGQAGKGIEYIPRVGYSVSPSHRYEDFFSIKDGLNTLQKKLGNLGFFTVYMGDGETKVARYEGDHEGEHYGWFKHQMDNKSNVFSLPAQQYERYLFNLKNIDIMLCPLAPNIFNMSKSDIKLVEAGAWGIPGLAPRYITYSRNWIEEENCLMYSNEKEFIAQAERLIKSKSLRDKLGKAAIEYVQNFRLEKLHSHKRNEFYRSIIKNKKRMVIAR